MVTQGYGFYSYIFSIFLNNVFDKIFNPIYSIGDGINICYFFSYYFRPSLVEVGSKGKIMSDALNQDLGRQGVFVVHAKLKVRLS